MRHMVSHAVVDRVNAEVAHAEVARLTSTPAKPPTPWHLLMAAAAVFSLPLALGVRAVGHLQHVFGPIRTFVEARGPSPSR